MDYRIEQLRYLLREDPSSRIFYQLGELLRREGEVDEAVTVLRAGLERHPRYVAAWMSLGRSLRDLEAHDEAEAAFEEALAIDPDNAVAARLLGETALRREDWLRAVKALKLARALTGADEALDGEIAMVEARLAEDGRLEAPPPARSRRPPPPRSLEVVSLSADDPFAADADEPVPSEPASDVFEIVEVPVPEVEAEVVVASAELEPAGETPAEADGEGPEEPEVVTAGEAAALPLAVVDEGSVGAWSASSPASGVVAEAAWLEPGDDDAPGPSSAAAEPAWAEPAAAPVEPEEPAATPPEITVDAGEPVGETVAEVDHGPSGGDRGAEAEAEVAAHAPTSAPDEITADAFETDAEAGLESPPESFSDDADEADDYDGDRRRLDHGLPLPTMTLARLALEQDDRPLAVATLESLVERDPGHAEAIALLDELRAEEVADEQQRTRAGTISFKVRALQGWLDAVRLAAERRVR